MGKNNLIESLPLGSLQTTNKDVNLELQNMANTMEGKHCYREHSSSIVKDMLCTKETSKPGREGLHHAMQGGLEKQGRGEHSGQTDELRKGPMDLCR